MIRWWLTPVEFVPEGEEGRAISHKPGLLLRRASLCATRLNWTSLAKIPLFLLTSDDSDMNVTLNIRSSTKLYHTVS